MLFQTSVEIPHPSFSIQTFERMLFVGSCFADRIGKYFQREKFLASVNPYGVMYNPASICHTVERWLADEANTCRVAFFTLGTNHVYVSKATGEVVDNCQKRPQRLFDERLLSIDQCVDELRRAALLLKDRCPGLRVVVTVSPIRYAKYGFHGSALSKAVLLLAADKLQREMPEMVDYFPAYEIVNDELRDYRFYQPDMLHPSDQAVEYIWQRFAECYLSTEAKQFIEEWRPIREALGHRPFNPDSDAYRAFLEGTRQKALALQQKYPLLQVDELER